MQRTLPELVAISELVVVGKIEKVSGLNFIFKIDQVAKGKWEKHTIEVQKFSDWTCASRYSKYEKGQKAVLFLCKETRKGKKVWRAMGAGNEGEWELSKGKLIDRTWTGRKIFGSGISGKIRGLFFWWKYWRGADNTVLDRIISDRYDKDAFLEAVRNYQECFKVTVSQDNYWIRQVFIVCSDASLKTYRNKSDIHRMITDQFLELQKRLVKEKQEEFVKR